MYVYALIYAIGPAMAFYITQDLSADIVWRIIAGASANYIYFWHAKEQLAKIKAERAVPLWLARCLSQNHIFPVSYSKYGTVYQTNLIGEMRYV